MSLNWTGLEIEEHIIESVLGQGNFATVYAAKEKNGSKKIAFKVARTEAVKLESATGFFNTQAQAVASSGLADIMPEPNELLACQYDLLSSVELPGIIKVSGASEITGLFYYKMPFIEGETLRQKIIKKTAVTGMVERIARTLSELHKSNKVHADLKPENIIVSSSGPLIIDPGYFGTLKVSGVKLKHCGITTSAYYPLFSPDDLMALGIIFWEIVFGKNPFAIRKFARESDRSRCGPKLLEFVDDLEAVSKYDFSAILSLPFPKEINPKLNNSQEESLLSALRLKRDNANRLEISDGYSNFDELAETILELNKRAKK